MGGEGPGGDPLFFSSLYKKTCAQTRSAETADATYGRLPRSRFAAGSQPGGSAAGAGLRRTPQPRRHRCEAAASVSYMYAHAPGREATMAGRGAWIKGGPSQFPEEAAALAFFRVPRICFWHFGSALCIIIAIVFY